MIVRLLDYLSDSEIDSETIAKFRLLVLDLAVRGKLAPQHPEDENASILLEGALEEQTALIEAKAIKRKNMGAVEIEEQFFETPSSWEWTRIWRVAHDLGQGAPTSSFSYVDVSAIDKERGVISGGIEVLQPEDAPSRARKKVARGCVIYSTVRPYLKNIAIVNRDFEPQAIVSTAFSVLMPYSQINNRFLYYYLRSPSFVQYVEEHQKGLSYPAINDGQFQVAPIPLPPFSEQLRIVKKVDQLMQLLDDLDGSLNTKDLTLLDLHKSALSELTEAEDAESAIDTFNRIAENADQLFSKLEDVENLRQTILQLAVTGKLLAKSPDTESASVLIEQISFEKAKMIVEKSIRKPKKISPVDMNAIPFDVPEKWTWTKLGNLGVATTGKTPPTAEKSHYEGDIPFIGPGQLTRDGEILKSEKFVSESGAKLSSEGSRGDVLMVGIGGTIGKSAVVKNRITFNQQIHMIHPLIVPSDFVHIIIQSPFFQSQVKSRSTGTATPQINRTNWENIPVPLPPLEEITRIVEKVNELMSVCDSFGTGLVSQHMIHLNLMDSFVIEALEAI